MWGGGGGGGGRSKDVPWQAVGTSSPKVQRAFCAYTTCVRDKHTRCAAPKAKANKSQCMRNNSLASFDCMGSVMMLKDVLELWAVHRAHDFLCRHRPGDRQGSFASFLLYEEGT